MEPASAVAGWGSVALLAVALGCVEARPSGDGATVEEEAPPAAAAETAGLRAPSGAEAARAGSRATDATSPQRAPPWEEEAPPPEGRYRLLLVNPGATAAVVRGNAGAATVTLDTVPARDSTRVDVRLRGDRLRLEAVGERGGVLGDLEVPLLADPAAADSVIRWEIGPPPEDARDGGATGP